MKIPPALRPIFDRHGVEESHHLFLYRAFDRLVEEDYEHHTIDEVIAAGVLGADSYEELLQEHDRGHRQNKKWFRAAAYEDAVLTKNGRALLQELAAANPDWTNP